jgi:transcriptional regulator with XRE-family HTH domain/ribosomal protein L40E
MENIGERIYLERKRLGLSQSDLAQKIMVSTKAVSKWETGEAQPTLDNVARLAEVFGVTTDYLLSGKGPSGEKVKEGFHYLEPKTRARHGLRVAGWICLGIGLTLLFGGLIAFVSGFGSFSDFGGGVSGVLLFGAGGFLTVIGAALLGFGYYGSVARYTAGEVAPVAKDTTNYMLDGTREELSKSIKTAAEALKTPDKESLPVCPRCGTVNEKGAHYCDHCGALLGKICPNCGENNDGDALHCRKCGKPL